MVKRKIALFGGTFDPIHLGHTAVAADAAEAIGADKTVFVPAKRSPLKGFFPKAGDSDRLKMISLAIAHNINFQVSDYELKRSDPSYTLETVRKFQSDYGYDTLIYWLIGADSIDELQLWYGITDLIDECNLATMLRGGSKAPNFAKFEDIWGFDRIKKLQQNVIETSLVEISSTEIRSRLAADRDVADMLDPAVADYIYQHGLYKSETKSSSE
jgi:nicotinate-nucleotide adenylyltransferase